MVLSKSDLLPLCWGSLVLAGAGCGKAASSLAPVQGKVIFDGKALTAGTVIFYPAADKGNHSLEEPRGKIDGQGNYKVLTGIKQGVTPGWYKIAVTAAKQLDPKNPYFTEWLIPQKYIDYRTSKLAVEVVANPEPGRYDLKLDAR